MPTSRAADTGTIALADQLNRLRERVPLSERDVARATGVDETTVGEWFERKTAPEGPSANRLAELIALVNEMALNVTVDSIPPWLAREVPVLDGRAPADVLADGGYEQLMNMAVGLSQGTFS